MLEIFLIKPYSITVRTVMADRKIFLKSKPHMITVAILVLSSTTNPWSHRLAP